MHRWSTFSCLALVWFVAACSSSGPGADAGRCRQVGTGSGVSVYFEKGVLPSTGEVAITACVDEACRAHVARAADSLAFVPVLPTPPDADVTVRVTVLSGKADTLFEGSTPAHTHVVAQSGPGCAAPAAQVNVIAHRGGGLTVAP